MIRGELRCPQDFEAGSPQLQRIVDVAVTYRQPGFVESALGKQQLAQNRQELPGDRADRPALPAIGCRDRAPQRPQKIRAGDGLRIFGALAADVKDRGHERR